MKINDIENKKSTKSLTEEISRNNATGFLTEDLVEVVKQDQDANWSAPMSADQLMESMNSWLK
jgi:hypothetical protein